MAEPKRARPIIGYLATGWGGLWAFALGPLLLAPRLLAVHHLRPADISAWVVLDTALATIFVAIGAFVSFLTSAPVVVWRAARGRGWDRPGWLAAFLSLPLLAVGYLAASFLVAWFAFGWNVALDISRSTLFWAAVLLGAALPVFMVTYRRFVASPPQQSAVKFALLVGIAGIASLAILPLRIAIEPTGRGTARPTADHLGQAYDAAARNRRAPLLFVGLDSGNWTTLDPMLARHELPTLERLIQRGIRGRMKAEWVPYWSRPAWAAILTGFGREDTGIHEDLAARVPGLPPFELPLEIDAALAPVYAVEYALGRTGMIRVIPPPRTMLQRRPFWELLQEQGIQTAVVRFDFSYPADGEADVVISNRVGHDAWDLMKVVASDPSRAAVAPASDATRLLQLFNGPSKPLGEEWSRLAPPGPHRIPRDAVIDPEQVLRIAYDIDSRSFDATEQILHSHRELGAVALYLPGFDGVCHAFWPYRFPGQYPLAPPDPEDVRRLGPVIDRYLQFLDRRLAQLLARFDREPNLVLVSDHGHEASDAHPLWRGWHGPEAIFVASGPGFAPASHDIDVSYFDITPTLLAVERLSRDRSMPGRPIEPGASAAARAARPEAPPARPLPRANADIYPG